VKDVHKPGINDVSIILFCVSSRTNELICTKGPTEIYEVVDI